MEIQSNKRNLTKANSILTQMIRKVRLTSSYNKSWNRYKSNLKKALQITRFLKTRSFQRETGKELPVKPKRSFKKKEKWPNWEKRWPKLWWIPKTNRKLKKVIWSKSLKNNRFQRHSRQWPGIQQSSTRTLIPSMLTQSTWNIIPNIICSISPLRKFKSGKCLKKSNNSIILIIQILRLVLILSWLKSTMIAGPLHSKSYILNTRISQLLKMVKN